MTVQELIKDLELYKPETPIEFDISIEDIDNGIYVSGRKRVHIEPTKDLVIIEIN